MHSNSSTDYQKSTPDLTTSSSQTTVPTLVGGTSMAATGVSSPTGRLSSFRSATLARQPSFDHGGEGRLSSTQVKQRLKTYLLNRRKQSTGTVGVGIGNRPRRGDDRYVIGSQVNFSQGAELSPSSVGQQSFGGGNGVGGLWDSNDSANSFDSDWNEMTTGDRFFQPFSSCHTNALDSHETCSASDKLLLQLTEMLARTGRFTTSNPDMLHQFRQQMLLLNFAKTVSDSATKPTTGQTRTDLRKTISEPDLVETGYPWPLRLVSHLISQTAGGVPEPETSAGPTNEYWNPVSSAGTVSSGCHPSGTTKTATTITSATTTGAPLHWSSGHELRSSSTAGIHHSLGILNTNVPRPVVLEPLVEPPFHIDSSGSSGERTADPSEEQCPLSTAAGTTQRDLNSVTFSCPTKQMDLRVPLESSTSVDSAFLVHARTKTHLNAVGGSFPTFSHESPPPDHSPRPSNPHEVAMDWESEAVTEPAPPPLTLSDSGSSLDSNLFTAVTRDSCAELQEAQERIFELWCGLPVEDWCTTSSSPLHTSKDTTEQSSHLPTAVAFDPEMLHHKCLCSSAYDLTVHPESPARMSVLFSQLIESRIHIPPHLPLTSTDLFAIVQAALTAESPEVQRDLSRYAGLNPRFWHALLSRVPLIGLCRLIRARMVTEDELRIFHSEDHIISFGRASSNKRFSTHIDSTPSPPSLEMFYRSLVNRRRKSDTGAKLTFSPRLCKLSCGGLGVDSDTVWNPSATARAARLATGQVLCLAHKVAKHELRNGFALVRPPGHHAEPGLAMGFCYFNSVAVAALHLLRNRLVSRLLILDWDIHHGNGTKLSTLHPGLVYVSIHRHDGGTFFPGTGTVTDSLVGAINNQSGTTDGTGIPGKGSPSQLINIAWGGPARLDTSDALEAQSSTGDEQDRKLSDARDTAFSTKPVDMSGKDAVDRRQIWRQYYSQHRHPDHSNRPNVERTSGDTSTGSAFHSVPRDVNPSCSCQLINCGNSTGSSHACSLCFSHRSSSGSLSIQPSVGAFATAASAFYRLPEDEVSASTSSSSSPPKKSSMEQHSPPQPPTEYPPDPVLGLSDAEYLAAIRCVVIPVLNEFKPEMILVSAGFDAAHGHPEQLGGYSVSPGTFAWITRQCMSVTNSRVVLALEGGYIPSVVSDCVIQCLNSLILPAPRTSWVPTLHDPSLRSIGSPVDPEGYMDAWLSASDLIAHSELTRSPRPEAVSSIMATINHQARQGWRCFANVSEDNVAMSFSDAMEWEQNLHGPRSSSNPGSIELSIRNAEFDSKMRNSPLTEGLAQLHMNQC